VTCQRRSPWLAIRRSHTVGAALVAIVMLQVGPAGAMPSAVAGVPKVTANDAADAAFREGYARCRRQVRRQLGSRIPHKYRFFHVESCVARGSV
jgi:hypothetical protein